MTLQPEYPTLASLPTPSAKRAMSETKSCKLVPTARGGTPPPPADADRQGPAPLSEGGSHRRTRSGVRMSEAARASPFDAEALDSALVKELGRPQRESTPSASPSRKRQRINGDRFVYKYPAGKHIVY